MFFETLIEIDVHNVLHKCFLSEHTEKIIVLLNINYKLAIYSSITFIASVLGRS